MREHARGLAAQYQATHRAAPLRRTPRERIAEFDKLVRSDVPLARQALRKLLDGPITFDASSGDYVLCGKTKVGPLISKDYVAMVPRNGLSDHLKMLVIPWRVDLAA